MTSDHNCLKNFLLHFISSLKVSIFENSNFVAKIYFIFLKACPRSHFKCFQYENCVKGLRVTKIVKEIKFEEAWDGLEGKYCFQRQSWPKYIRQTLVLV